MGTRCGTPTFWVLYANIDRFNATKYSLEYDKLAVMDKWLLSKMNSMVKTVDSSPGQLHDPRGCQSPPGVRGRHEQLVRCASRDRFWAKGMEQDKINAYMTLYTALVTVAKAAAPRSPS